MRLIKSVQIPQPWSDWRQNRSSKLFMRVSEGLQKWLVGYVRHANYYPVISEITLPLKSCLEPP